MKDVKDLTNDYNNLIKGVVLNYIKGLGNQAAFANADDWIQESWMKILEYAADHDGEYPDFALAKKIIKNHLTDLVRKATYRNHDFYDEAEDEDSGAFIASDNSVESGMLDDITAHALLNLFPEGTPENTYVKYWLEDANWKDFGFHPPVKPSKRSADTLSFNKQYEQNWIAQELGFVPGGSRWRNWKARVDAEIAKAIKDSLD